jgi:hypothetical protein
MADTDGISNEDLQKIVTETFTLMEFLLLYMFKYNIVDEDSFKQELIQFYNNGKLMNTDNKKVKYDKFDMLNIKDSIFNFTNTGES